MLLFLVKHLKNRHNYSGFVVSFPAPYIFHTMQSRNIPIPLQTVANVDVHI